MEHIMLVTVMGREVSVIAGRLEGQRACQSRQ
jgi:hypothetical protein